MQQEAVLELSCAAHASMAVTAHSSTPHPPAARTWGLGTGSRPGRRPPQLRCQTARPSAGGRAAWAAPRAAAAGQRRRRHRRPAAGRAQPSAARSSCRGPDCARARRSEVPEPCREEPLHFKWSCAAGRSRVSDPERAAVRVGNLAGAVKPPGGVARPHFPAARSRRAPRTRPRALTGHSKVIRGVWESRTALYAPQPREPRQHLRQRHPGRCAGTWHCCKQR